MLTFLSDFLNAPVSPETECTTLKDVITKASFPNSLVSDSKSHLLS